MRMEGVSSSELIAVANLREFFRSAMQEALSKCHVAVDDHTEHYVVNVLATFARTEAFLEQGTENRGLSPLAILLAEAREAPTAHHTICYFSALEMSRCSRQASLPTALREVSSTSITTFRWGLRRTGSLPNGRTIRFALVLSLSLRRTSKPWWTC